VRRGINVWTKWDDPSQDLNTTPSDLVYEGIRTMIDTGQRWTGRVKSSDENERIRAVIPEDTLCTPTSIESLPENSLLTVDRRPTQETPGILSGDGQTSTATAHRWSTSDHLRIIHMLQVRRPANLTQHIPPIVLPISQDRPRTVTRQGLTRLTLRGHQMGPCQLMSLLTEHECTHRTHSRNRHRTMMLSWGLVVDQAKCPRSQASRITLHKVQRHLNLPDSETPMT
jgi:hypothetical protein